jgi:LPS export ABC transporter protein LptC
MILASRSVQERCSSTRQKVWQVGTLGWWLVALLACGPPIEPPARPSLDAIPPVVLETVHFSGYRGDAPEFEVLAERADVRAEKQTAELHKVDIQFRESERGPLRVQADRAELNLASDDFVLHENVRGELGDGERFTTSEVRYEDATQTLHTNRAVRIERGRFSFQGKGMEIDVPTRRMSVVEPTGETR